MKRILLACAVLAAWLAPAAQAALEMPSRALERAPAAPVTFRAPALAPRSAIALPPLAKSEKAVDEPSGGALRVGTVRSLEKAASLDDWHAVRGGFVATLRASSAGATGLRVKLDLAGLSSPVEVRVQGAEGRIEHMVADPSRGPEAWTPWTDGESQRIELFTVARPEPGAVRVAGVVHFERSPFEKAAAACTVPTACTTNDPALDAAIAERKKSIMRINYVKGASSFMCSATLINTQLFPSPYVLTANHCIDHAATANSITSWWFYEALGCDGVGVNPDWMQVPGGMELVFGNYNLDASLLHMNALPPFGAVYSGYNGAKLVAGLPVVSLSHPTGDTSRLALATTAGDLGIIGYPQPMASVNFTRGIIEGGSSGSGLFSMASGGLQLRSILSGSTVRGSSGGLSCSNLSEQGLYSRFDIFLTQIEGYIRATPRAADDAPNRARDLFDVPLDPAGNDAPLDVRGSIAYAGRQINYAGDLDVYRFVLSAPALVSVYTDGADLDTVGSILDSRGVSLQAEDDVNASNHHFGITRQLGAGTYYVQVGHWDVNGTGPYTLRLRADNLNRNYTSLWWNPSESGWGININHQGNILFATLFSYDASGQPMWLVMDRGELQSDGAYLGNLYRASGPAFNALPFTGVSLQPVGTMRIAFPASTVGQLTYTVDGATVSKAITRQEFAQPLPVCGWSAFDRVDADNYQDLWWNPSEPGWGINIAHQGDIVFATLFTYDTAGRGLWLVMDRGVGDGSTYSGTLYRTAGPAFNASPFDPARVTASPVGSMTLAFRDGNAGTLTYTVNGVQVVKQIQRQVFEAIKPYCR